MKRDTEELEAAEIITPGNEHFDLQNWPFYWITQAYGQYITDLEITLKRVELDIPSWRVLILLDGSQARSISYLASAAISKLSTMTRIVQRMQDDDLVITRQRASDQRVTEVLLTSNGKHARILALKQAESIYARSFREIPIEDLKKTNTVLAKIFKNLTDNP